MEVDNNYFNSEGLGSGQTQQTVNLPPRASKVRILPPPPLLVFFKTNIMVEALLFRVYDMRSYSSAGRALPW
tara:strand:+ start:646 stop:861 length:216 start_codon:yes stop_codon:yes gene_type:complete